MAEVACESCGASLIDEARFCSSCGIAVAGEGTRTVGVHRLDASGDSIGNRNAPAEAKSEGRSWLALAGLAIAMLIGLFVLDRGDGADDSSAEEEAAAALDDIALNDGPTPTSTSERPSTSTTSENSATSGLAVTRQPSFSRDEEPSTAGVDLALGIDATLYLAGIGGAVWSVELLDGTWNDTVQMGSGLAGGERGMLDVRADVILVSRPPGLRIYRFAQPDEGLSPLVGGLFPIPSANADRAVVATAEESDTHLSFQSVDLEGNVRWTAKPPINVFPVGAIDSSLVLSWNGQTVLYPADGGEARAVADGPPVSFEDGTLLWGDCGLELVCTGRAGTIDDADRLTFPEADLAEIGPNGGSFGGTAALVDVDLDASILVLFNGTGRPGAEEQNLIEIHDPSGMVASRPAPDHTFGNRGTVRLLPGGDWVLTTFGATAEFWNWRTGELRAVTAPTSLAATDILER